MRKFKFEHLFILIYIIAGSLWILFSDILLSSFVSDPLLLTRFQTFKGWFYVAATAFLFYFILKSHLIRLRGAESKAVESDMLKTAFLQNISHEIRTPMNSIIGFSDLILNENLSEAKRSEYLRTINISSLQLLNVVNSILDISMIETGNMIVTERRAELNKTLDELYTFFRPLIKNEITFTLEKGLTDEHALIYTDEPKIRKVMSSLINNAVKFTEKGHITFGYTLKKDMLEFFVEDSGPGIPEDFRNNIFSRFQKAEMGNSRVYEGIGLGLAICKGSIELLDGKMWVESKAGKGSTFYFTIPYKPFVDEPELVEERMSTF